METLASILIVVCALGCGLMGGFFYAFSGLVMPSLARRPAHEAAAAMQAINVVVLNPLFFLLFFGPAAAGLVLSTLAPFVRPAGASALIATASVVYAVGCVGVTIARNVPLNEALERLAPEDAADFWQDYLRDWSWWNHVRTIACVLAAVGFLVAA